MGNEVMTAATETVLVALTGLSGAVLVAALVTRFIPTRSEPQVRHSAVSLFEGVLVAVTITSAMLTAESSLVAIHKHKELSSDVLSHIAMPLVFGVVILVVLAMISRLAYSAHDGWSMFPVFVAVLYVAIGSGFAIDLNLSPSALWPYVAVVLMGGAAIAFGCRQIEIIGARRAELVRRHSAVAARSGGREYQERELAFGLPGTSGSGLKITCAVRDRKILMDVDGARRLADRVGGRWQEHAEGRLELPASGPILSEIRVRYPRWRPWKIRLEAQIDDGASEASAVSVVLYDGHFDIAGLVR